MATSIQGMSLPTRLLNFFTRYPPEIYSAKVGKVAAPLVTKPQKGAPRIATATNTEAEAQASNPTSSPAAATLTTESRVPETSTLTTTTPKTSPIDPKVLASTEPFNPFLPTKNPITRRWRGAAISLRRQAELVKLARTHGVEELLPPGKKSSAFKEARLLERGLRVKGTGEGQKVKGHKWERMKSIQLEERKKAMEEMPEMIRSWKQRGHGKWWKKYPR